MILVSGVNGFVGHHLTESTAEINKNIMGIGYGELKAENQLNDLLSSYLALDLTNSEEVKQKLDLDGVEVVFHLAGLAAVGPSYDQPSRYITENTAMLINLAEKALVQKSAARFIIISSGGIYDPRQELPISETGKLLSNSPYAVSKITNELLCDYYRLRGLDMVIARPFNHIGPGQGPGFILPDLVLQAEEYKNTGRFSVGNLETKRDYTDVRDVVRAYMSLGSAKKLESTVYNVCSGQSFSGQFILDEICKQYSIDNPKTEVDQSKIRPSDILDIRGDNSRIKADTGWKPEVSVQQSVEDFIKNR